jgi:hypothetical protein
MILFVKVIIKVAKANIHLYNDSADVLAKEARYMAEVLTYICRYHPKTEPHLKRAIHSVGLWNSILIIAEIFWKSIALFRSGIASV